MIRPLGALPPFLCRCQPQPLAMLEEVADDHGYGEGRPTLKTISAIKTCPVFQFKVLLSIKAGSCPWLSAKQEGRLAAFIKESDVVGLSGTSKASKPLPHGTVHTNPVMSTSVSWSTCWPD